MEREREEHMHNWRNLKSSVGCTNINFLALTHTTVNQDVNHGAAWMKGAPVCPVQFFATFCKSIIISK